MRRSLAQIGRAGKCCGTHKKIHGRTHFNPRKQLKANADLRKHNGFDWLRYWLSYNQTTPNLACPFYAGLSLRLIKDPCDR